MTSLTCFAINFVHDTMRSSRYSCVLMKSCIHSIVSKDNLWYLYRVVTVREKSEKNKNFFKGREKSGNFVKGQGKS